MHRSTPTYGSFPKWHAGILLRFALKIILGLLMSLPASAQQEQLIRGVVVDSTSFAGLANVNIRLTSSMRGTASDAKGAFVILASPRDTLVLSRVGYFTLKLPLAGYEASLIRLKEKETFLPPIVINDSRLDTNPYEGLFDEQRASLMKKIPFYYSRARKDKLKAENWRQLDLHTQVYVDLLIRNAETKERLMKEYDLGENEYYEVLAAFNEEHFEVMYFLTRPELVSLLNRFFEREARRQFHSD